MIFTTTWEQNANTFTSYKHHNIKEKNPNSSKKPKPLVTTFNAGRSSPPGQIFPYIVDRMSSARSMACNSTYDRT